MAINNYNEFLEVYDKPNIDGLIVGFSGIDPQRKQENKEECGCDKTTLSDEQKAIVDDKIHEKFRELEIRIDSGNVDPNEEDDVIPGYLVPSEIDHETLKNLYGGGSSGHYHLSKDERDKIIAYPSYSELSLNISQNIQHERLLGLLGGDNNGHYHLTQAERSKLQGYPEFATLSNNFNINHEKMTNLLGGDDDGHYHLTQAEHEKVAEYPAYSDLSVSISQTVQHEKLLGLLGGNEDGHYHLTQAERNKLQNYPEFANLGNSLSVNHEKITGLLGGNSNGHYHMADSEHTNLLKIITALFPNGASEVVLPSDVNDKLSRETWTFVLEDDTTYQRDVAIWN